VIESDAGAMEYGVVFEDDGETGYFYARDFNIEGSLFVDALHIYTVAGVRDADNPSFLRIVWSQDWKRAALLINDSPHAMFDFDNKIGYSVDEFPEPDSKSGWSRAPWNSDLKNYFYRE
jgi:hypothetical protein